MKNLHKCSCANTIYLQDQLEEHLNAHAYPKAALNYHTLKGSALTLGAVDLADFSKEQQNRLNNGEAIQVDSLLSETRDRIEKVGESLAAIISRLNKL